MAVSKNHCGFTLIEVLVVIGIIVILASIVFVAIRPQDNFIEARNTERRAEVAEIISAINQWIVDGNEAVDLTQGDNSAITSCDDGADDIVLGSSTAGEVPLDDFLVGGATKYISEIPTDPKESSGNDTGYDICNLGNNKVAVLAPGAENNAVIAAPYNFVAPTPTNSPTPTPGNSPTPTNTPTPTDTPTPTPTSTPTTTPTPTTPPDLGVQETVSGSTTSGTSINLSSWTPGANELVLVAVALRDETKTVSVSGNGLTFVEISNLDNFQLQGGVHLFRAMGASPSTGQITISIPSNSLPVYAVATRFVGADTSGTNGSGAIEAVATDAGPMLDNNDMKINITTLTNNAWAFAAAWHRLSDVSNPPGTGETSISLNNTVGSSGDMTKLSTWYDEITIAGSTTLGQDNNLAADRDWAIIAVSIKPAN